MRLQEKFSFDDSGVSPVVGVILMVAITVILAAVIGTFVLDLGGQVQQNAQAGVTFDENEGTNVDVQLNSVQSADHIYVQASRDNTSVGSSAPTYSGGVSSNGYSGTLSSGTFLMSGSNGGVGQTVTVTTENSGDGTVTVVGVLEGSESVIQTYEYTGGA